MEEDALVLNVCDSGTEWSVNAPMTPDRSSAIGRPIIQQRLMIWIRRKRSSDGVSGADDDKSAL
jgi:hypothetical protein